MRTTPQNNQVVTVAYISGAKLSTCSSRFEDGWFIPLEQGLGGTRVIAWQGDDGRWKLLEEWPTTVEQIRAEISRLEGELSRIGGKPILIRDGMNGGTVHADIPPGGALLDFETGIAEQAYQEWYPDLEAAKAGLVLLQRGYRGELSASGLHLNADPIRAFITRREQSSTIDPVCAECGGAFDGGPVEETHKGRCHPACARGKRFVSSAGNA